MLVTGLPGAWVRQGYGETAVSSVCQKLPASDRVGGTVVFTSIVQRIAPLMGNAERLSPEMLKIERNSLW